MYTGVHLLSKDAELTQVAVVRRNSAGLTSSPTRVSRLGDPYEIKKLLAFMTIFSPYSFLNPNYYVSEDFTTIPNCSYVILQVHSRYFSYVTVTITVWLYKAWNLDSFDVGSDKV